MENVYIMVNKDNGVKIETTQKYVAEWIARGFEVKEIIPRETSGQIAMDGNNNPNMPLEIQNPNY